MANTDPEDMSKWDDHSKTSYESHSFRYHEGLTLENPNLCVECKGEYRMSNGI